VDICEVDFDNIERVRTEFKARFKKETGASLSYLPFISRAVCDALRVFPTVNSSIDLESKTMTLHSYVNLGVAVDLDEQGLVVPVVKDADTLNIRGIASQIATKAAAARQKNCPTRRCRLHVHDHEPRPVRQLCIVADHQSAERGHPVHRRCEAAPGRRRRRHRHPSDGNHRNGVRPPRIRRFDCVEIPSAHQGLTRTARLVSRAQLTCGGWR
jgi:hypothetical protein